jgi:hypothetical protein
VSEEKPSLQTEPIPEPKHFNLKTESECSSEKSVSAYTALQPRRRSIYFITYYRSTLLMYHEGKDIETSRT